MDYPPHRRLGNAVPHNARRLFVPSEVVVRIIPRVTSFRDHIPPRCTMELSARDAINGAIVYLVRHYAAECSVRTYFIPVATTFSEPLLVS